MFQTLREGVSNLWQKYRRSLDWRGRPSHPHPSDSSTMVNDWWAATTRDLSVSYSIKLQTLWACTQSKCIYVWSCTFCFLVLFMSNKTWGVLDWHAWLNKTRDYRTSSWQTQTADYVFRKRKFYQYVHQNTVIISDSGGLSFNNPRVISK